MAKDTFYFSHDYNARSDEKIKKLIRKHGMVGYGLFWSIIEDLYQNNNSLELDYDLLTYEYRVNEKLIKSVINDFALFTNDEKTFGSVSISKRIDIRNEKSKAASNNAYKRWGKSDARQQANDTIFYIIRMFSDTEEFIKCGITNETISRRFSGKTNIYSYEVLKYYDIELEKALNLEKEINSKFHRYTPVNKFGGFLECYKMEDALQILEFAMQCECKGNAKKERKGKDIKEIKEKEINFSETDHEEIEENGITSQPELKTEKEEKEKSSAKKEKEIPAWEDFEEEGLKLEPNVNLVSLKAKFQSWVENGWKDGHGNKIKNWRLKIANTIGYLPKVNPQFQKPQILSSFDQKQKACDEVMEYFKNELDATRG